MTDVPLPTDLADQDPEYIAVPPEDVPEEYGDRDLSPGPRGYRARVEGEGDERYVSVASTIAPVLVERWREQYSGYDVVLDETGDGGGDEAVA